MGTRFSVTTSTPSEPLRQDVRRIRRTLQRLAMFRLIVRLAIGVLAFVAWLLACRRLLAFGHTFRYDSLITLDPQVSDLLVRLNPYLWGAVALLLGVALFFVVKAWFNADANAQRARPVPVRELAALVPNLTDDALDVVRWVWRDPGEPLSIGDLVNIVREIRTGRVAKMSTAREQAAVLNPARSQNA